MSNGINLVPFVIVFEVYFVGIVQNVVHVVVRDCHYPGLAVSGFDKRESGVTTDGRRGQQESCCLGPINNVPH